ncbi:MAG: G/U mismatch-specific DNA glycosylase [Elainella sp. Prado103]|jgi:TDG/mug DNA glycosylase family protein|nr:G/U mismatch-specific DNA glycosylase [Elainella sp. Prado103]
MQPFQKPTKAEIQAAVNSTVPDIIAPNLTILFCGINPSLYSAVVGHHFARPGNRFWKTLYGAGFTDRLYHPAEDRSLLQLGYGITNLVDRATARADELAETELLQGRQALLAKIEQYQPQVLAILGVSAYRTAFMRPKAQVGLQAHTLGQAQLWILPNPSGLNAHYQLADLNRVYEDLRLALL